MMPRVQYILYQVTRGESAIIDNGYEDVPEAQAEACLINGHEDNLIWYDTGTGILRAVVRHGDGYDWDGFYIEKYRS